MSTTTTPKTVVPRPYYEEFLKGGGRRLAYGRRKTGKTYYARLTLKDHDYYIVRPGGTFLDPSGPLELRVEQFARICRQPTPLIVDEFHRAPPLFFDLLQAGECTQDLLLLTSTLHYHTRLTQAPGGPLKGLFAHHQVGLITPGELALAEWGREWDRELLERLVFLQEPTLVQHPPSRILGLLSPLAYSLVGEVLAEEDHALTLRFHSVLEAIAMGRTKVTEIANHLAARGLLDKPSPGAVSKYLHIMTRVGLLERIPVWGRAKTVYRHTSPLTWAAYYLSARYGLGDVPLPPEFAVKALRELVPQLIEVFVERALAQALGLRPVKITYPQEVDIALARGRSLVVVGEVKWRSRLTRGLVKRVESKLYSLPAERRVLVVPSEEDVPETSLEVIGPRRLRSLLLNKGVGK